MKEKSLSQRIKVVNALVAMTPFLPGNHDKNRISGYYREWALDAKEARIPHCIGIVPVDRVTRYHDNALRKVRMLASRNRPHPEKEYVLTWQLLQDGIEVFQGGKYEESIRVASAFSGLDAPVDEAVILVKDYCLGYTSTEKTLVYAQISKNEALTLELLNRAESAGLVLP